MVGNFLRIGFRATSARPLADSQVSFSFVFIGRLFNAPSFLQMPWSQLRSRKTRDLILSRFGAVFNIIEMKTAELAKLVGRSRSRIARIASGIPGHRRTRGGRPYFARCPELNVWIKDQQARRRRGMMRKKGSMHKKAPALSQEKFESDNPEKPNPVVASSPGVVKVVAQAKPDASSKQEANVAVSFYRTHVSDLAPPVDGPISDRINFFYAKFLELAICAVMAMIETGNLLTEQKAKTPVGQWLAWLEANCPYICDRTARRYMAAAAYVQEHGSFNAQTIRQLYIEAGIVSNDEAVGNHEPAMETSIITPLVNTFKKVRLFYTDDVLAKITPTAAPHVIGWLDQAIEELGSMKKKLENRGSATTR
jgi:hypothetical protein